MGNQNNKANKLIKNKNKIKVYRYVTTVEQENDNFIDIHEYFVPYKPKGIVFNFQNGFNAFYTNSPRNEIHSHEVHESDNENNNIIKRKSSLSVLFISKKMFDRIRPCADIYERVEKLQDQLVELQEQLNEDDIIKKRKNEHDVEVLDLKN